MGLKHSLIPEVVEHFSSRDVFHPQVQIFFVLGNPLKVDDEGVLYLAEDLAFVDDVVGLLSLHDLGLFHDLDGHDFFGFFVFGELHLAEGACVGGKVPTPSRA